MLYQFELSLRVSFVSDLSCGAVQIAFNQNQNVRRNVIDPSDSLDFRIS